MENDYGGKRGKQRPVVVEEEEHEQETVVG
jgi:hypothetical protein